LKIEDQINIFAALCVKCIFQHVFCCLLNMKAH